MDSPVPCALDCEAPGSAMVMTMADGLAAMAAASATPTQLHSCAHARMVVERRPRYFRCNVVRLVIWC